MLTVVLVGFTCSLITPFKISLSFMLEEMQLPLFQFDTVGRYIFPSSESLQAQLPPTFLKIFFSDLLLAYSPQALNS